MELAYLPGLYERVDSGSATAEDWQRASTILRIFAPPLHLPLIGKRFPTDATHGYMRSPEFRRKWLLFYPVNLLFWWLLIFVLDRAARVLWTLRPS